MDSVLSKPSTDQSTPVDTDRNIKKTGMTWLSFLGFLAIYVFIGACGDPAPAPGQPATISIITGEGGFIDTDGIFSASWTAPTGDVSHYDIEYSSDGTQWLPVITGVTNTSFSAITLSSGQYQYRFRACNGSSCGDWSSPVSINVSLFSSAQAIANNSPYEVYRGDVNGDQIADLYFKYKADLVVLHSVSGGAAAPLTIPSDQDSFLMTGLASGGFADPVVANGIDVSDLISVDNDAQLFDYDNDGDLDLFVDLSSSGQGNIVFDLIANTILASDILFQQVGASATVAINPEEGVTTGADYYGVLRGNHNVNANGSFTYSIPIEVPPGINGMQPNLSLSYNSNRRNGVAGWGWALGGQSMIGRCRATLMRDGHFSSVNNGAKYKFCLDGERLVEVAPQEYRTEQESFNIIRAVGGTAQVPDYWTVTSKDGSVYVYGDTGSVAGTDSAETIDSEDDTLQWKIRKHQDLPGNYMTYHYYSDMTTGEQRLTNIDYTKNTGEPGINHRVVINYEDRIDTRSGYQANRKLVTNKRIASIETRIGTNGSLSSGSRVSRYALNYQQKVPGGTNYNDPVDTSRIANITRCFANDSQCAKPLTFEWQDVKTINDGEWLNLSSKLHYADFNGDGLLDVLGMKDETSPDSYLCDYRPASSGSESVPWLLDPTKFIVDMTIHGCPIAGQESYKIYIAYGREKITPATNMTEFTTRLSSMLFYDDYSELVLEITDAKQTNGFRPGAVSHGYGLRDFNGDGLMDIMITRQPIVDAGLAVDVYLANRVAADSNTEKFTLSAGYSKVQSLFGGYVYQDLDGDGLIDSYRSHNSTSAFVGLNNGSGFDAEVIWSKTVGDGDSDGFGYIDRNSDGVVDLSKHLFNVGHEFSNVLDEVVADFDDSGLPLCAILEAPPRPIGTSVYGADQARGDFNGDGKEDFLQFCDEGAQVSLGTGNARLPMQLWSSSADTMVFVDTQWSNTALYYTLKMPPAVVDINNDGLDDLINRVTREVWFSTGSSFVGPFEVFGDATLFAQRHQLTTRRVNPLSVLGALPFGDFLRFSDINGDGLPDLMDNLHPQETSINLTSRSGNDTPAGSGVLRDFSRNTSHLAAIEYGFNDFDHFLNMSEADVIARGFSSWNDVLSTISIRVGEIAAVTDFDSYGGPFGPNMAHYSETIEYYFENQGQTNPSNSGTFADLSVGFIRTGQNNLGGHQLLSINEGFGRQISPEYTALQQGDVYSVGISSGTTNVQQGTLYDMHESRATSQNGSESPWRRVVNTDTGSSVVSSLTIDNGRDGIDTTDYAYGDMRAHRQGFGSLGFGNRTETSYKLDESGVLQQLQTQYEYYQTVKDTDASPEKYHLAGRLKRERDYIGPATATEQCSISVTSNCLKLLSETRYQWKVRTYLDDIDPQVVVDTTGTLADHDSPHFFAYLAASSTENFDLNTGALISQSRTDNQVSSSYSCSPIVAGVLDGTIAVSEVSSDIDYHIDGVMLSSRTTTCDAAASSHAVTGSFQTNDSSTITSRGDVRGLVQDKTTVHATGASIGALTERTREVAYSYNSIGQVASSSTGINGTPEEQLTTSYLYNDYGTPNQITESWASTVNNGLSEIVSNQRQSSVTETYNSQGQRTVVATNAKAHSSTTVFDARFATPVSETDINGLLTSMSYDALGRVSTVNYANGNSSENRYIECNDCFAYSPHEQWYTYSKATGAAPSVAYFDGLGQAVGGKAIGLNGAEVFTYSVYNQYNEVITVSDPFFAAQSPVLTQMTHDVLGRTIKVEFSDGSEQTTVFNGNTETKNNRESQTQTHQYNHAGWMIQSVDNDNTPVDFTYYPFGDLKTTQVNNNADTLVMIQYDTLGRKTQLNDPNTGIINYRYSPLGLLASEEDAKGQITQYEYDVLGRQRQRIDDFGSAVLPTPIATRTHNWAYDTAVNGVGLIASLTGFDTDEEAYSETYNYNSLTLPVSVTTDYDGHSDTIETRYDDFSRPLATVYPTGYITVNRYNANGYLSVVKDALSDTVLWQADAQDARGNITQSTLGNGVVTTNTFDPNTGLINGINAAKGGFTVQDHTYQFSALGNLEQRTDVANNINQYFCYDNMNRLRVALTGTACTSSTSADYTYDKLGNIKTHTNSPGATYDYGTNAGPHAVTSIGGKAFNYDANGNFIQSNAGVTFEEKKVSYSAFNKPTFITRGASIGMIDYSTRIAYGPSKDRVKRIDNNGKTTRYVGGVYEESRHNGELEQIHYIGDFAMYVLKSGSTASSETVYQHRDHIGSIVARTYAEVNIIDDVDFMANDAWGNRVDGMWGTPQSGPDVEPKYTARGFTDHEHLDGVGFIHMNGRVYDPEIGRFLSPDPLVQAPNNTQSYNRYSYVFNNPLSFTDPTGYSGEGQIEEVVVFAERGTTTTYSISLDMSGVGAFTGGLAGLGNIGSSPATDSAANGARDFLRTERNKREAQKRTDRDGIVRLYDANGFRKLTLKERQTGVVRGNSMGVPLVALATKGKSGTTQQKLARFKTLWKNYPAGENGENAAPSRDGYENQCAIRLGMCFIDSGVDIASFKDNVTSEGYPRGAQALAKWLSTDLGLSYKSFGSSEQFLQSDYASKSGVIFFNGRGSFNHIDLYNGDTSVSPYERTRSGFFRGKEILFFPHE